jgi:hypothetical protein
MILMKDMFVVVDTFPHWVVELTTLYCVMHIWQSLQIFNYCVKVSA